MGSRKDRASILVSLVDIVRSARCRMQRAFLPEMRRSPAATEVSEEGLMVLWRYSAMMEFVWTRLGTCFLHPRDVEKSVA